MEEKWMFSAADYRSYLKVFVALGISAPKILSDIRFKPSICRSESNCFQVVESFLTQTVGHSRQQGGIWREREKKM